jgi:hypothetical protein
MLQESPTLTRALESSFEAAARRLRTRESHLLNSPYPPSDATSRSISALVPCSRAPPSS